MKENNLFVQAANNDDKKLKIILENLSDEDKQNILESNLSIMYDTSNIESKMKFINRLPFAYK